MNKKDTEDTISYKDFQALMSPIQPYAGNIVPTYQNPTNITYADSRSLN